MCPRIGIAVIQLRVVKPPSIKSIRFTVIAPVKIYCQVADFQFNADTMGVDSKALEAATLADTMVDANGRPFNS